MARTSGARSRQSEPGGNPYAGGGPPPPSAPSGGTSGGTDIVRGPRVATINPHSARYDTRFGRRDIAETAYEQVDMPVEKLERYISSQVSLLGMMGPGQLASLQDELAAVGLLSGNYVRGGPDASTKSAFEELLGIANQMRTSWRQALNRLLNQMTPEMARSRGFRIDENGNLVPAEEQFVPPALQLQLPNKKDVDALMRRTSVDLLGQGWDQRTIDAASNAFISEVKRLQTDAYNQMVERERQLFETGTTNINQITEIQAPSPETFAEEQVKQRDPMGYQTNTGMELLMDLIGAWGG